MSINRELLASVVSGAVKFLSPAEGMDMLKNNPPLIEVDPAQPDPTDPNKAAVRATAAATEYLAANTGTAETTSKPSSYAILTGVELPEAKKRGSHLGSGVGTKYPFADMPVGGSFFSANSEHRNKDALKALGSTVSAQNRKYATPDGDKTKVIKQAVRGADHKPVLGPDGKKQVESKTIPVLKYERKFTIRGVSKGYKSGSWEAPEDGALIARTL